MAINTIKATIQMRSGMEDDFDPSQMTVGEWSVSKDTKYVRMCFMPGLCLRMAIYESFEEDMQRIQEILTECRDIQKAVSEFVKLAEQHKTDAEIYSKNSKSWAVGGTGIRSGEDTDNSEYYSKQSRAFLLQTEQAGIKAVEDIGNAKEAAVGDVKEVGDKVMESINTATSGIKPDIHINSDDGHMYYTGGLFGLVVNQSTGHLEVSIA